MCNYKKAAIVSIISYVVVTAIIYLLAVPLNLGTLPTNILNFLTTFISLYILLTRYYMVGESFKDPKSGSIKLGLVIAIFSTIINMPVMIFIFNYTNLVGYFLEWSIWADYFVIVASAYIAVNFRKF